MSKSSSLPYAEFKARGYRMARTPYFSVKVRSNSLHKNRIGAIVTVAAVKSAVRRNFWKRQVKNLLSGKDVQNGMDILVIFSSRVASLTKKGFAEELLKAVGGLSPRDD